MIRAPECICGKAPDGRMIVADGTCLWCGRGVCANPSNLGRRVRLRRLPRDLGALAREGRRPDPQLDNVVRLDRLREAWKVPHGPLRAVRESLAGDWSEPGELAA